MLTIKCPVCGQIVEVLDTRQVAGHDYHQTVTAWIPISGGPTPTKRFYMRCPASGANLREA